MTWNWDDDATWPDGLGVIISSLRASLTGVGVDTKWPADDQAAAVRIERAGGPVTGVLDNGRYVIEVRHRSLAQAWPVVSQVRSALRSLVGEHVEGTVTRSEEIGGPAQGTDPGGRLPLYLLTQQVTFKARRASPS